MLLNQSSHALANRLSKALEGLEISVRVYCALAKAVDSELTQGQLAEAAWMDKTTMVVTLDEMERRGLAERKLSPIDRRVRVIAVTDAGRSVLIEADTVVQRVYDEVLEGVGERDREACLAVLSRLVAGPPAAPFQLEKPVRRRAQRGGV
jgi:DNA-binding MarR family transcriptional regulator